MNLWMITAFFIGGLGFGYLLDLPDEIQAVTEAITRGGLILLLVAMGAKIGINDKIIESIDTIGWQAFIIALCSVTISILLVAFFTHLIQFTILENVGTSEKTNQEQTITILILGAVGVGVILGVFILPASFFSYLDTLMSYAFAVLLLGIGINIGSREHILKQSPFGLKVLGIPLFVALGSLLGGLFSSYLLGTPLNETVAVSAGFGWYSLSGVLITELHSAQLGLLAFLSNVFREVIAIIICPLIANRIDKITSIAPGGAATMDVMLPVIKETAGDEYVVPAFINGAVLTSFVPLLVPLFINL